MRKVFILIFLLHFSLYGFSISNEIRDEINSYEDIKTKNILYKYYKKNSFKPFWIENNNPKTIAFLLIDTIDDNTLLKPYKNELFNFRNLFFYLQNDDIINFELQLTLYYDKYIYYLNRGIINIQELDKKLLELKEEEKIDINWQRYVLRKNRRNLLHKIIKNDDISLIDKSYKLTYPNSNILLEYINKYEQIIKDGGFIKITKDLKLWDKNREIKKLRQRLIQEDTTLNLLTCKEKRCILFDNNLKEAVINFQKKHGLKADGVVGKNTRKYLNMSAQDKIALIRLNIERTKWLPKNLGKDFFIVNIPEYNLKLYKEDELTLNMPIVVGEKRHPTAIFSNKISAIVLNPYWRIPQSIVKNELIPRLEKEPDYLKKNGIKIHESWEVKSQDFDSSLVDWKYYTNQEEDIDLPLKFIQEPNNLNPLGKMKFLFPNKYAIYLHDTPSKEFFAYNKRAFSHGCIRLSKPHILLETIANINEEFDFEESLEVLKENKKIKIELNKSIPIHIVYLTAWVDENKQIQFRDDIYDLDKLHEELIKEKKWLY